MGSREEKKTNKTEGFMKSVLVLMISQVFIKLLGFVYRVYLTNRDGFGDEGNAICNTSYYIIYRCTKCYIKTCIRKSSGSETIKEHIEYLK